MIQLLSQPVLTALRLSTKQKAAALIDRGIDPQLGVVLVGDHPDSLRYISMKTAAAQEMGIILSLYHLEDATPFLEIEKTVSFLSGDPDMHGIILQLPLPVSYSRVQTDQLLQLIAPEKDVDGLTGSWEAVPYGGTSLPYLLELHSRAIPPMVCAVLSLLDHYRIDLHGKRVVVVGKGRLVGQPLYQFLKKVGIDIQAVDEETEDILSITSQADILICGTGQKDLVTYQWVKEGAVVIDCAHDVHVDSVSQVASALSPSKGGVGPLTVAWLLHNTVQAAGRQHE